MLPTGGVNAQTAGEFIAAGAAALGVGGELVDIAALARGEDAVITERARELVAAVAAARARSTARAKRQASGSIPSPPPGTREPTGPLSRSAQREGAPVQFGLRGSEQDLSPNPGVLRPVDARAGVGAVRRAQLWSEMATIGTRRPPGSARRPAAPHASGEGRAQSGRAPYGSARTTTSSNSALVRWTIRPMPPIGRMSRAVAVYVPFMAPLT